MAKLNPYINFLGKTEEAFNFYKSVFGGEFKVLQKFKDTPMGASMSDEDKEKIMHVSLPIGKDDTLMGTDEMEATDKEFVKGNNFSLSLHPDSKEEADKLFSGLSEGGEIEVPLEDAMWGAYFGMFKDKFGMRWMVNYEYPKEA